jgi:hypothetical protein
VLGLDPLRTAIGVETQPGTLVVHAHAVILPAFGQLRRSPPVVDRDRRQLPPVGLALAGKNIRG